MKDRTMVTQKILLTMLIVAVMMSVAPLFGHSADAPEYIRSVEDMLSAGYEMIPDVGTFSTKGQNEINVAEGERMIERFINDYPSRQLMGFVLCSWARPVPYHKTKGLKSIEFFGDLKRRWESAN